MLKWMTGAAVAAALAGTVPQVCAQQAPLESPLTIVVGYAPGGSSDRIARLVATRLTERVGVPVVVENKSGAGGRIAAQGMRAVSADQNVLMLANPAVMVVALGSAPPIPRPAMKRNKATVRASGAKPIAQVAEPKRKTLAMTAIRRPKRSANNPAHALPIPIPMSPAATAGANASRVMPHSWIINGMAKPISCPSKPSRTIENAAIRTTIFCIRV